VQLELLRYQRGEISFDQFARETNKAWLALSVHLLNRWKASPAVSPEDLQQELLIACWRCIPEFDAARGVSLESFVVYNSFDKAKKWLHKQRNAYRRDDKSPGRFPVSFASLGLEPHAEERLMSFLASASTQEDQLVRAETILAVEYDDLAFMLYQRSDSIEDAARKICASPLACVALQTATLEEAQAVVERSIERAAEAVSVAAA
jgi:hypothetical protein